MQVMVPNQEQFRAPLPPAAAGSRMAAEHPAGGSSGGAGVGLIKISALKDELQIMQSLMVRCGRRLWTVRMVWDVYCPMGLSCKSAQYLHCLPATAGLSCVFQSADACVSHTPCCLQKPKKLTFVGSDGLDYSFLAKPKDDLRKDYRWVPQSHSSLLSGCPDHPRLALTRPQPP